VDDLALYPRRQRPRVHRTDNHTKSHFDRSLCGCISIALPASAYRFVVLALLRITAYPVNALDGATDANQKRFLAEALVAMRMPCVSWAHVAA
jgi:hypothetical protein